MRELEAVFDAALADYKATRAAFKRSRTQARLDAFHAAEAAFEAAADALRAYRGAAAKADLRARRLASVAPRRAAKAEQGVLF